MERDGWAPIIKRFDADNSASGQVTRGRPTLRGFVWRPWGRMVGEQVAGTGTEPKAHQEAGWAVVWIGS